MRAIDEIEKERKVTNNILKEMREKFLQTDFNIDIEIFQDEIAELLDECERLKKIEEDTKYKLKDFYNLKASVDSQIVIVQQALKETHLDLVFVSKTLPSHVDCPTCGANYENNFMERFAIADDEERCKDLLIELTKDQIELTNKILDTQNILSDYISQSNEIDTILEKKKEGLRLKDVIDNFGRNHLHEVFKTRIDDLNTQLQENAIKKGDLDVRLKALENKDRKQEIVEYYRRTLSRFLMELDVHSINQDFYNSITNLIENVETGSSKPRALIAYYFTFFFLMEKYSTTTYCPIVIDSPNQQDQDKENIDQILNFINSNQPDSSQLILGVAELYGADFNCQIIELKEKYSLLQLADYEEINEELAPYFDKMWLRDMFGS
ncbi:hypothetical protein GO730_00690 [Spirosoma sp. HMF3257]|uniref:Uncharacterized protein n=1 Tax=Spirosoma telluris TaxID=2183553 RepID=A0A327NH80_9BACT|nr:hypothetical protein [Spirosoma telluris]RAI73316.1 hypothetical protein HMF3257_00670 [Spirosoma telluris]